ncbi:NUDIX hydrolase [Paracoccus aestuariivivens]|uniref:NUDIX domain-containing protein n=1 Tax=Paracoccus aestuariivivens TaxID=1820333 RepID=A0A6L6J9U2_9RHOB|nr:NUDIX hydrolase [Paracoccus aestuariivivens]MTH77878.1 NUDIX domain-containing protein [Paracoccus aestuariivivens]
MKKRYGVICYLPGKKQDEVILVTSRRSKNWIFPKGRKIPGMSGPASARREAYEEAGLLGRIDKRMKFRIATKQAGEKVELLLYAMRVDKLLKRWPEARQRSRLVISRSKAEKLLDCPDTSLALKKVLGRNKR